MNKRIEELAAKIDCMQDKYGLYHSDVWDSVGNVNGVDLEKFAELIIQECLEACSRVNEIRYFAQPLPDQVVLNCMIGIEKHFGIEP